MANQKEQVRPDSAFLIIDVQNDFCPGGSLAVPGGDQVVPLINELQIKFGLVLATKDWHPQGHSSFQMWPPHCIQGSRGAEFPASLETGKIRKVFLKGVDTDMDSYSGFFDNAHERSTGLGEYLKSHQITSVYIAGLATDYCVKYTALDALALGFATNVVVDACRGVEVTVGDTEMAISAMKQAGVKIVNHTEVPLLSQFTIPLDSG